MARQSRLSATFVKNVNRPGRYGDGRGGFGLSLLVKPASAGGFAKSWSQRLRVNGQPVNVGLGSYPIVNLAEARTTVLANRRAVAQGIDPRTPAKGVPTFAQAAEKVIEIQAAGWRQGGKSEKQWRFTLEAYAFPQLGDKKVNEISSSDVMAVLLPIWNKKHETARRVRQRIDAVMEWAIAEGHRDSNPAGDAIGAVLPKPSTRRQHRRALEFSEVEAALGKVRGSQAWPATKLALEFVTLCAVRSGEARLATWDEIHLESATWKIPAERMKCQLEHRVPLSTRALNVLNEASELSGGDRLVFPSVRGKPLSDSTLSKLIRELDIPCVPHGMRTSFRNWAAECTDAPSEVCELALAHVNSAETKKAYFRTDLFDRRRDLMQDWSDYLNRQS